MRASLAKYSNFVGPKWLPESETIKKTAKDLHVLKFESCLQAKMRKAKKEVC